ncbi:phospholipid phosphatase 5-like [Diadema antillarum]|uniref:phospholipid phosphatase 5-like n=1 Tax=Diadema antillarum TaxID=105358 RepID=UPI003A8352E5
MLSCRCTVNTQAVNMFAEVFLRLSLFAAFLISEDLDPFQRVIQPEEMWLYKNPHVEHSTVSTRMLFILAILVPLCTILVFSIFRKDHIDFVQAVLACSLAELLNSVLTNSIKLVIGRPRPDFFTRCFPDGVMTANLVCTGDPATVKEGRKSFPSGHSSLAFCAFGFVAFYLAGKLHTVERQGRGVGWKIVATLLPLYIALMVALSRTADYRHHYQDVAVGSLLGLVVAYGIYRQYYPPLTFPHCDKSYAALCAPSDATLEEISVQAQSGNIKLV